MSGDGPALGGHDQGNPDERRLPGLSSHRVALAHPGQFREGGAVTGAGHLLGQAPAGRREPRQPRQAGPDDVSADQHEQPGTDVRRAPGPPGAPGPPAGGQVPPVRGRLGAAGGPALLPGVPGLGFQPAHHREQALTASLLAQGVAQRERRSQETGKDFGPGRPGLRPRPDHRPRREPRRQLRASPAGRPHSPCPRRRRPVTSCRRQDSGTSRSGHSASPPNRFFRLSAR